MACLTELCAKEEELRPRLEEEWFSTWVECQVCFVLACVCVCCLCACVCARSIVVTRVLLNNSASPRGGGGGSDTLRPLDPDFIVGKNEIYRRKY